MFNIRSIGIFFYFFLFFVHNIFFFFSLLVLNIHFSVFLFCILFLLVKENKNVKKQSIKSSIS